MARQSSSGSLIKEGGQVEGLVEAIIDAAYDKDTEVRRTLCRSLVDIGSHCPELVLRSCHRYLSKRPKLDRGHRVILLQSMDNIVKEAIDRLPDELAQLLIRHGSDELTQTKDVVPEWQTAASSLLVALGRKKEFGGQVIDSLLSKFPSGTVPHFFVIQTLGTLAGENAFGVVPRLKDVISRMLPVLAGIKHDNFRWAFCSSMGKFCDAILDYLANMDKASDKTITAEMYHGEMYAAFDVMFNVWLLTKEAKLRLAIVEAVGSMTHLMSMERLAEITPKLIPTLSMLYRKHNEHYFITNSLCMCLDAIQTRNAAILDPQLDVLLCNLHPLACIPTDFSNPVTVKNHNELLRCFNVMARSYSDRVLSFMLNKLEVRDERSRIGTLDVLKHLINSTDDEMEDKKALVVSGLKILLSETNNQVKKMLAQVVIAMAHHQYLELEGGHLMIEFIVRQCALPVGPEEKQQSGFDQDMVTNGQLKQMCDNVLQLLTNTVQHTESVLWPYLLECIVPTPYTEAMTAVCRSAAQVANKKRVIQAEDYELDYEILVNVPKPPAMISRLLVMAGHPHGSGGRGIHVLNLLMALGPNLHENVVDLWDAIIPKLTEFLEENSADGKDWNQKRWEDMVLKLLSKTLDEVDDEEWICGLGYEMGIQICLYNGHPNEKNFLFKCIGVVLRKSTGRQFMQDHLNLLFSSVDHSNQIEREGCAMALGFCAASHLDAAVEKLQHVAKDDMVRKSTGFLGLMKDKSEAEVERVKSTVMLCYGQVTFFAPVGLITSRIEVNILRSINPHFVNVKDTSVKQNLIRAVDLIGKSLHPNHLQTADFVFQKRGDLLAHMQTYIKAEPTNFPITRETVSLAMNACATLVMLEPHLSEAEEFELIKTCTDAVFKLPAGGILHDEKSKGKSDVVRKEEAEASNLILKKTFESMTKLLCEVLMKRISPGGLESITKHLEPWMVSAAVHERERSVEALLIILTCYIDHLVPEEGVHFINLGHLIARVTPRCTDRLVSIRKNAIDSLQLLLRIAARYRGALPETKDQLVDAVSLLRERADKDEANALFGVINDMAKVLAKKLPADQLNPFIYRLMDGLIDVESHSSSGACVVLNSFCRLRGAELTDEVSNLVKQIISQLDCITSAQTHTGTLRSLRTLTHHHLNLVVTTLLDFPLPLEKHVIEAWQTIGQDKHLTNSTLDLLLDLLARSMPYNEKQRQGQVLSRSPTPVPKAVTCAFAELFCVEEVENLVQEHFHRLFSALLVRIGSCAVIEETNKKPQEQSCSSYAMTAMKELLRRAKQEEFLQNLSDLDVWAKWESMADKERFAEGLTLCAKALCDFTPDQLNKVIGCLAPILSSLFEPQRVAAAAFFAELINQRCLGDMTQVELLMNSLLGRLIDTSHVVRMLCVRGLGNIASIGGEQLKRYSTTVLSAMMAGMDDKEDPEDLITLEAMSGLSKILGEIDEAQIRPILINICLKIRPCFVKMKPGVRAAAFELFGNVSRFGDGPSRAPFLEQIHTNFVSLLMHLNEEQPEVALACKKALRKLSPLLGSTSVNNMFQKHLLEDAQLMHYGEFMNDLSRLIIADFPDKISFYTMGCIGFFKSVWKGIRANAAMFVGFLLGNLPLQERLIISKEHICGALVLLLKDPAPIVRRKAGEAMSLLYNY